jgi:nucleotide-binding universal stress UspA family protein
MRVTVAGGCATLPVRTMTTRGTTMTKVLVPIDGSEHSLRALGHAMKRDDEIHLVNVQIKADTPVLLLHMTAEEIERHQLANGRSTLEAAVRVLDAAKRRHHDHVAIGDPAHEIARVAAAEHVDSIVMGTRGMGALANLTLGSVATKVVHLAAAPVTLVK